MTTVDGVIIEIKNGVLVLKSGVRVRVPTHILERVEVGKTIKLYVYAVPGARSARDYVSLFGFESEAEREAFRQRIESDATDPIGTLAMASANRPLPEAVDEDADEVMAMLKRFIQLLRVSEEVARKYISETPRTDPPHVRAESAIRMIADSRGIKGVQITKVEQS